MTPEQRKIMDRLAEACYGPRTFNRSEREAVCAALADLDARLEDNGSLIEALRRALADLDACRKALGPVATKLVGWQDGPPVRQLLARTVCLSPAEAAAVLAAEGEETP